MKKYLLVFMAFIFIQSNLYAANIKVQCEKCLTQEEYNQIVNQLEQLIKINRLLSDQLERLQLSNPELSLEPIQITIDKEGRVFVKDKIKGKIKIAEIERDVTVNLKTTVVKSNKKNYNMGIRFKAAGIINYEIDSLNNVKSYNSGALAVDTMNYDIYNLNLVISPRLMGLALGIDITSHFDFLIGLGTLNQISERATPFFGAAFDF